MIKINDRTNPYNTLKRTTCRQNKLSGVSAVPIIQSLRNNEKDEVMIKRLKNYCKKLKINYKVINIRLRLKV